MNAKKPYTTPKLHVLDTRTIQEVLQLHVDSAQSMYDTYERTGDVDGCRYEKGKVDGLKRAIEVANNMANRRDILLDQLAAAFRAGWEARAKVPPSL